MLICNTILSKYTHKTLHRLYVLPLKVVPTPSSLHTVVLTE